MVFPTLKLRRMSKELRMLQFKIYQQFNRLICFLNLYKLITRIINKINRTIWLMNSKLPKLHQMYKLHSQLICLWSLFQRLKAQRTQMLNQLRIIMNYQLMSKLKMPLLFKHRICSLSLSQLRPAQLPLLLLTAVLISVVINQKVS